jgi:hypothetical protein
MNPAKAATASKADLEKMKKGCSNNCKNKKRSDAVIACYAPIKDLEVSITTCNTFGLCIKDAHDSTSHKPEKKQ